MLYIFRKVINIKGNKILNCLVFYVELFILCSYLNFIDNIIDI